jgi:hypothetical protein
MKQSSTHPILDCANGSYSVNLSRLLSLGICQSRSRHYILLVLFALLSHIAFSQQIAFPGAEGAGKWTSGGRGTPSALTTVYEVTNLTDANSPGSLRYAVSATATYRTIVFRVSGTIHLTSKLNIKANTTLAGQTAPGDGICIADYPVAISGDNVIVRYMRFRMGDKNQLKTSPSGCGVPVAPFTAACMPLDGSGGDDAFGNLGNKNIIIDHCSVSWSSDEALTVYRGDSLTLQWNLISEPLNYSYHFETGDADFESHAFGGIWGAKHGTFHHNLFAHAKSRNPRFAGNSTYGAGEIESADFRNNVIYNWGLYTVYGGDGGQYNLVNNYFKYGPSTGASTKFRIVNVDSSTAFPYAKYYMTGNYVDGSTTNTNNNWLGAQMLSGNAADTVKSKTATPFIAGYLPSYTDPATFAYDTVLKAVGAIIPRRDTLDDRVINDVKLRQGKLIDVQGGYPHGTPYAQTVNAWPTLNSDTAPVDTDHDGMPDTWETTNALNPNGASDRGLVAVNVYTNLENYLNGITGSVIVVTPTNPATAVWTLFTDQTPSVVGNITATNQTLGSYLAGIQYGSTFGGVSGWQRVGTTSSLPIGYDPNAYTEYTVKPSVDKNFLATSIELGALGGGTGTAKIAVYYSFDGFVTSTAAGTCAYNNSSYDATVAVPVSLLNTSTTPLAGEQLATIPVSISVQSGQTLAVRVYAWITGTGNRYFASQNVKINGVTSNAALPLHLLNFSASASNNVNKLYWNTANESNMQYIEIEKSNNGTAFRKIGSVTASNAATNNYSFTDNAVEGTLYYRLKMVNKDGSYTYSFVVSVKRSSKTTLSIYPNPVKDVITVTYAPAMLNQHLNVLSIEGKTIHSMEVAAGSTQTTFNLNFLQPGIYMLRYANGNELQTIKLVKE